MIDLCIIGGGTGGVAAALAACKMGLSVLLTEETSWIGGQLTSQAVPPDEHPWIDSTGASASYREFRNRSRAFYRDHYPTSESGKQIFSTAPSNTERLYVEPRIAHHVLEAMLSPWISKGTLTILLHTIPVAVERSGRRLRAVEVRNLHTGKLTTLEAAFILDATEEGDLLELAKIAHITGSEGRAMHGELHDLCEAPRPQNLQAITWVAALGYHPDTPDGFDGYRIDKPASYDFWSSNHPPLTPPWPGPLLDWRYSDPRNHRPVHGGLFGNHGGFDFWRYRLVLPTEAFEEPLSWKGATMLNWPQNDYFEHDLLFCSGAEKAQRHQAAKELTLSLIYWLQNHAPRPDGGEGYPGLYLRPDQTGTPDGLAQAPYIREARRILARRTVVEGDLGAVMRENRRPDPEPTSIAIGYYRIDLHPTTEGDNYIDIESFPFQIPLGALLSPELDNFLPAAKNIGMTHITNGCLRLHPVEWSIGEAAGALAAYTIMRKLPSAHTVLDDTTERHDYRSALLRLGVDLEWPKSVFEEHAQWLTRRPAEASLRQAQAASS